MSDAVDDIDALVEWQMSNFGGPPKCPQDWCDRAWHGFPITRRIEAMRLHRQYDSAYKRRDDDSEVLCPGSTFEGEFETPAVEPPAVVDISHMGLSVGDVRFHTAVIYDATETDVHAWGEWPAVSTRQWRAGDTETPPHYIEPTIRGEAA